MKSENNSKILQKKVLSVQFLRGIAVLLVIFYHYGFISYGYIGVDLFFAISGYVIMTSINRNNYFIASKNAQHDLNKFIMNRFNRIYPPLLFLILITSVYSFFQLTWLNNGHSNFAKNILLSSLGFSNIYSYQSSTNYFDANNFHKPLLHLWSVAAEFQIYFIIAGCLYLIIKKTETEIVRNSTIFLLSLTSLLTNTVVAAKFLTKFGVNYHQSFIFYSPIGRFWEFGFGCLVFICYDQLKHRNTKSVWIFSPILILIFTGLLIGIKNQILFILVLLPIFILITKEDIFNKFYTSIFVLIGNRSYSAYLFHMPVIYFFYYSRESLLNFIISLLIITVLSNFSYSHVEKISQHRIQKHLKFFNFALFFLIICMVMLLNGGLPKKIASQTNTNLQNYSSHVSQAGWELPFGKCSSNQILDNYCGPISGLPKNTIIGDSHAGTFVQVKDELSGKTKFNESLIEAGCSIVLPEVSDNPSCTELNSKFKIILNNSNSDSYLFAEDFALYGSLYSSKKMKFECTPYEYCAYSGLTSSNYFFELEIFINELLSNNEKRLTIIGATPRLVGWPNQFNLWNISILNRNSIEVKSNSGVGKKINADLSKLTDRLNSTYNNRINFIDSSNFICFSNEKSCEVYEEKNGSLYWDADHLSIIGAQLLITKSAK